jgi:hypothetical protein
MIRAEEQGVVFFHNPKTAGSSINRWFLDNIPRNKHIEPQHILPKNISHTGWSFCAVRNPWDRWVSWWAFWYCNKRITTSFEEYTTKYLTGYYDDPLNGPYSELYVQSEMANDVDYVMRFENLSEDFKVVQEKLGCYSPLPHTNAIPDKKHYTEYYTTNDLITLVGEHYKEDVERFGYQYAV